MSVKLADLRVLLPTEVRVEDLNQQRPATVADLVSGLRAEGVLESIAEFLFRMDGGGWSQLLGFSQMDAETHDYWRERAGMLLNGLVLDSLTAEAQPIPPAGG